MRERTFRDIPDGKITEADQQLFLVNLGWAQGSTWDDLLRSKRILIISEAGAGKTYECREQAKRLWKDGKPAFFVELTNLANEDLCSLLDRDEEVRLDAWLESQSEVATFFLDSIDELNLTRGSFRHALIRLKRCVGNKLNRTMIVITTRPTPFDEQLIREILPVPSTQEELPSEPAEENFVKVAMGEYQDRDSNSTEQAREWRTVALLPLSDEQIIQFSRSRHVKDPEQLLKELQRRNAQEFARRPLDLIELCADWNAHERIRTHREQVHESVRVMLQPRYGRDEPADLSVDKAMEGASRLALAVQMTRRLTIRHSAESDTDDTEAALDPAIILSDWPQNERKALLERPLFGFASYGRVRFQHRSVAEYLAAERLILFRNQGMSFKALKRLLFTETNGKTIVLPSKRPVAGWLALQETRIFELLRDHEPAVLLNEGDPESLTLTQRKEALRAYAKRYGVGGWRGLQIPQIQIHRFASQELADAIKQTWQDGVGNLEVRGVLLSLIGAGRVTACADIAFAVTQDIAAHDLERISALDALVALNDQRLYEIGAHITNENVYWPDRVRCVAVLRLFPKYMTIEQLVHVLRWIKPEKRGDLAYLSQQLPRQITTSDLESADLEKLRDELVKLVSEYARSLQKERLPTVCAILVATCERGLTFDQSDEWLHASVLVLKFYHPNYRSDEPVKSLLDRLANLNEGGRARFFWVANALYQSCHAVIDSRTRSVIISLSRSIELRVDKDLPWVRKGLGDTTRKTDERSLLLEAAIYLSPDRDTWKEHVEELRLLVADEPSLVQRLDDFLVSSEGEEEQHSWEEEQAEQEKQAELEKAERHDHWMRFRQEVLSQPEKFFSSDQVLITVRKLLEFEFLRRIWARDSNYSRSSGWNRRFIEKHFGTEIADRCRGALMDIWRNNSPPTLSSEKPDAGCNGDFEKWPLGLAGIYAEAEDPNWASNLSEDEAQRAARYALFELDSFPQWLESLADVHPKAIDQTLGKELSWDLNQPSHVHSMLLPHIGYDFENIAQLFLPRLISWLDAEEEQLSSADDVAKMAARVRRVLRIIWQHGNTEQITKLKQKALQKLEQNLPLDLRTVWLSSLIRINPQAGVEKLADQIKNIEPARYSEAVKWFATIFGDRQDPIVLNDADFTPQLLLQLLCLAYQHVRADDDIHHEGSYSPGIRDQAQKARNNIFTALLKSKGKEGLAGKLEIAADPLFAHIKDRILAEAEESWAQEIDSKIFIEKQVVAFNQNYEAPASTNEDMFTILKDRLSDLDELLLSDDSPRETWAGITQERVMRREIARQLNNMANAIYKVEQETVTADENRTDIRLRSISSKHEAVIELKLGDKRRTAKDLLNTIEQQLVNRYMAPEHRRSSALLVTLAKDRHWEHPDPAENKRRIDVEELMLLLEKEAERIETASESNISLYVHLLDLRPK